MIIKGIRMKTKMQKFRVRLSVVLGIVLVIFICFTESAWNHIAPMVATLLFVAGIILVGIASLGRMWCSLYIAGYKTKVLVTEGPYSISRNPLYFFSLLGFLGVGLCSETILIPAILLIVFILYYPWVIRDEEKRLRQVHKGNFEKYVAETPCFFPNFFKLREPEQYLVNPKIFRRHLLDTLVFVIIAGGNEVVEVFHKLHWLRTFFITY